jgi:hypothetical protein
MLARQRGRTSGRSGRYWARTSDPQLVGPERWMWRSASLQHGYSRESLGCLTGTSEISARFGAIPSGLGTSIEFMPKRHSAA